MSRIAIQEERCKGCLLCTAVCPVGIIVQSDRFNTGGYKVAEVDPDAQEKCTGCAGCALICPDLAITVYRTPKEKGGGK